MAKVRKPRPLVTKHIDLDIHEQDSSVWINCDVFDLWGKSDKVILVNLRALRVWLGSAIAWLEAREGK